MCGIFGLIGSKTIQSNKPIETLHHRGPDSKGSYRSDDVLLQHTRLAIIDLSEAGNQPMMSEDGNLILTYNGEIYNFGEVRNELIKNHSLSFTTNTDTEVLLKAYQTWGDGALEKFNGMFAFGVWNRKEKQLLLARDRFGVKPLVYYWDKKTFLFSSEIKGLLCMKKECSLKTNISEQALSFLMNFSYIPAPLTIYENIFKLEPGHKLRLQKKGSNLSVQKERWYTLKDKVENKIDTRINIGLSIEEKLLEAVKIRMRSDVPLGAFLSGGVDSSIIVGLMTRLSNQPVQTFSVGYKDNPIFDETDYAREVARRFNSTHNELFLDHKTVLASIPGILKHLDEPFGDSSLIPTYLISKEIRKNVTVALSGDGADEIFGGYKKYLGESYYRRIENVPDFILAGLFRGISLLPSSRDSRFTDLIRKMKKFGRGIHGEQWVRHLRWMTNVDTSTLNLISSHEIAGLNEWIKGFYNEASTLGGINKNLYTDIHTCLPNDMLTKVDLMSMANSLEVRSPFLDVNVVELAMSLPEQWKVDKGKLKLILRESFSGLLPKKILRRPKQGFEIPVGKWLKKELRDFFLDSVIKNDEFISEKGVMRLYDAHVKGKEDYSFVLWTILSYFSWKKNNSD